MLLLIIISIIVLIAVVTLSSESNVPKHSKEETKQSYSVPDNKWKETAKTYQDKMLRLGEEISLLESENAKLIKLRDSILYVD